MSSNKLDHSIGGMWNHQGKSNVLLFPCSQPRPRMYRSHSVS